MSGMDPNVVGEIELCWESCQPIQVEWSLVEWYGPMAIVSIDHHAIDNDEIRLFPSEARALAIQLLQAAEAADAAENIARVSK